MEEIVDFVNDIVWSPALIVLLLGAGLYFTIRTRCVQIRKVGHMAKLLFKGTDCGTDKSFSSFEAFCVALSGRVGTGNIVWVATAIALGGPGAVFWMWVTAFIGASTAFTEATLAQIYKFDSVTGERGGPAAYIEKGLKMPWLGKVFAILVILGYGVCLVFVQANSVSTAIKNSFSVDYLVTGILMAALLGSIILGGARRIAKFASIVTPFMAIGYVVLACIIICLNYKDVPDVFGMIFKSAFDIHPLVGGMLGSAISMGVKRGLFSNEAGEGGGAIVSATAKVKYPVQQGLVQGFSVYIDTLLVCTATALMILFSGKFNVFDEKTGEMIYCGAAELGNNYLLYTQTAVDTYFSYGSIFVSIALSFFAFTTIIAYFFYSESSIVYLFNKKSYMQKPVTLIYSAILLFLTIVGSVSASNIAWKLGDIGIGITTWVNIIVLLILFPKALSALKEYEGDVLKKKR